MSVDIAGAQDVLCGMPTISKLWITLHQSEPQGPVYALVFGIESSR